jgi:16S rRNA (adenine1518-N6/adenine1519-N6)-dimethyltransferase
VPRIDDLPPLREVIAAHGLRARRALGQNFLLDLNLCARIARVSGPLSGVTAIEVGPGPGGLTRALMAAGAAKVVAIERDGRAIPALEEIAARYPGRLEIVEGDALKTDFAALAGQRTRIVANLPYNVATPLLTGWLGTAAWPPFWDSLTLMFQREVAERIVADPGSRTYGRLSVLAAWRTRARIAFEVPPRAFTPPPKVHSAVVHMTPRADATQVPPAAMAAVTRAAFGQRRKMLRQSLKAAGNVTALLEAAGLTGTERAEDLTVDQFVAMARLLD